jgi:hypothetical protein
VSAPKSKKKKVPPDLGAHAAGYLHITWDEKEDSLYAAGGIPRCDQNYTFMALSEKRWHPPPLTGPHRGTMGQDPSFVDELKQRGYDITTIVFFVVRRQHPWIQPSEFVVHRSTGQRKRIHHVDWNGDQHAKVVMCIGEDMERPSTEYFSLSQVEKDFMPVTPETTMTFLGAGI